MLRTREELHNWLKEKVAREAKLGPDQIGIDDPFAGFGLDSIVIVTLVDDLEVMIGAPLDPTILWEYPTIRELSDWLVEEKIGK